MDYHKGKTSNLGNIFIIQSVRVDENGKMGKWEMARPGGFEPPTF